MKRALLSTVFWTEHQTRQGENPRIRFNLSDGELGKPASEFEDRYKLMVSGATVLSLVENKETKSMVLVEEFQPNSLTPSKFKHLMGYAMDIEKLPEIEDKRSPDMVGHPTEQIPEPRVLDPR